ncbi:MAG: nuclear transport factor 2 family protein [Sphingomonadaceae bacterium]|nr:nuclear transport factor 2 family protein [Sphingomonadaceae bacterium]
MSDVERRLAALEAEVGRLRDHLAIQQIIARYGPLVDSSTSAERLAKVVEYFGDEGIYDIGENAKFTGAEFAEQGLKGAAHQRYLEQGSTHLMAPPYVIVDGDRATALGYSHVFTNTHDDGFKVERGSVNYWEFARRDGKWRIVRRVNRLVDGTDEPRAIMHRVDALPPEG